MHNAAFQALGIDAAYVPIKCQPEDVPALMRALAGAGGGGNLTIPHKLVGATVATPAGDEPLSSCNTFWGEGGRVLGDETDSIGILKAWAGLGRPPGDWLVLGTGGSALAASRAAKAAGARVVVQSRTPARGTEFEATLRALGVVVGAGPIGLVVNCTPLGLQPDDPHPIALDRVPNGAAVLDLVYARGRTAWVRALASRGHPARDGREALLWQGAAAFERWFPGVTAPDEVMSAALARALG
jgi:shikimate dehydrogenase